MSIALYGLRTPTFKSQVYIEWLRHKAQNALVGDDRRTVRSRAACFFCRIFLAIERNGQTLNAIDGGNEWPANS